MFSVLLTILPVFLILGAGYLLGRIKYLPDSVSDALNTYALRLGVPILLFLAMFRLDFSRAFDVSYDSYAYMNFFLNVFSTICLGGMVPLFTKTFGWHESGFAAMSNAL